MLPKSCLQNMILTLNIEDFNKKIFEVVIWKHDFTVFFEVMFSSHNFNIIKDFSKIHRNWKYNKIIISVK